MKKAHYQEYPPSPRLARHLECFWTLRATESIAGYPVLPDGCVDILFARHGNARSRIEVVGAMTCRRDFDIPSSRFQFGVRFHPAMGRAFLGLPICELTDRILPLDALWGRAASRLEQQLAESRSVGQAMARVETLLESMLGDAPLYGPIERTAAWLVAHRGQASVDDLAQNAGLSARQFRRVCLDASGLTPKRLARVIRFRHLLARIPPDGRPGERIDWAQLALECGFYDQAHLINEFREFAGASPADYAARHLVSPPATAEAAD